MNTNAMTNENGSNATLLSEDIGTNNIQPTHAYMQGTGTRSSAGNSKDAGGDSQSGFGLVQAYAAASEVLRRKNMR